MSGVELVLQAVLERLRERGVAAEAAYSRDMAGRYAGPVAAVGLRSCLSAPAGLGSYLGEERLADGRCRDLYARQAELVLALDAYAPREAGAAGCLRTLEAAQEALSDAAWLRLGEMDWGEARFDGDTEMFVQRSSLRCTAFFVAAAEAETGALLAFQLKGVPWIDESGT